MLPQPTRPAGMTVGQRTICRVLKGRSYSPGHPFQARFAPQWMRSEGSGA
jgi:hypothetical protein